MLILGDSMLAVLTKHVVTYFYCINPLNAELNPICHLLVLLGAQYISHVSVLRVKEK